MDITYDQACYDLAESFLDSDPLTRAKYNTPPNRHALAQEIQQTIEDFLHDLEG